MEQGRPKKKPCEDSVEIFSFPFCVWIVNPCIFLDSASAPIFASAIALLNAERLAVKLPPLGFLNPLLYYFPLSVNDITSGSNPSCGTNGFPAKLGWDPVTGLGTPSYLKMQSIVLGL